MVEVLNYDALVEAYYENLHTTLRKFSPGPEYLDSWVHDEDHNRSILGIFESAESYSLEELAIEVSPKVAPQVDQNWLKENLNRFGAVKLSTRQGGLEVRIRFGSEQNVGQTHPAYAKALELAARTLKNQGTLAESEVMEGKLVQVEEGGVKLACAVDKNGVILKARHTGASGVQAAAIDLVCALLVKRPIQEGAEHAVIRLETQLRDPSVAPPVKGLVTPENADPIFKLPTKLVRSLFREYLKATKSEPTWNDWEDPMSVGWVSYPAEDKVNRVTKALADLLKEKNLPYAPFEVLSIKNDYRVILVQQKQSNDALFGHHLMQLEKELQKRLEPRLELVLESLEDKNHRESRTKRETAFNDRPKNEK